MAGLFKCVADEAKGRDVGQEVARLLAEGYDPHETDKEGNTPFNLAAANSPVAGRLMTLHWLQNALEGKGSHGLNDPSGSHGSTLAQYMAKWLHDDEFDGWVQKAVAKGMVIDRPNKSGWTPLMAAAAMGRVKVVEALTALYSHKALCAQATEDYTTEYHGIPVTYPAGANAVELAQERIFQDEDMPEALGEALWECMDIVAAAIQAKK